mmetsp:Transcript_13059/g.18715  ORF Transcript_13059/g.18715 Transcript_13059/m.18715 type:complete len:318 (-) Transcript_13059:115-1068(-)
MQWMLGMILSSVFSLVYLITPTYFIVATVCAIFQYPTRTMSFAFASPILFSALFTKPMNGSPTLFRWLLPMLRYFSYEEILECSTENLFQSKRPYIIACQPHGVISYCGICGKIAAPLQIQQHVPTAVASSLLMTPILKNVMGIFGLIPASSSSLKKHFQAPVTGTNNDSIASRSVVIYVGGIAELFKSSRKEERLYLSQRKGFIKLALRENVDVIPVYLFGNTSVLTVVKTGLLANLSRKSGVSLTYFWGKYHLPIPRDEKCLYVRGLPLNLPHIPEPTDEDINKWHDIYCGEVRRLFDKYKEKVPMYKDKTLFID